MTAVTDPELRAIRSRPLARPTDAAPVPSDADRGAMGREGVPGEWAWDGHTRALMRTICQVSDLLIPLVAIFVVVVAANRDFMPHGVDDFLDIRFTLKNLLLVGWFAAGWWVLCHIGGLYDEGRAGSALGEALRVLAVAAGGAAIALVFPLFSRSGAFRYEHLIAVWVLTSLLMLLQRSGLRAIARRSPQEIVIVGTGPRAAVLYDALTRGIRGPVKILGFIDNDHPGCVEPLSKQLLGGLDQLEHVLMTRSVDQVLITLPVRSLYPEVQASIETCARAGIRAEYLADLVAHPRRRLRLEQGATFATVALPVVSEDHWKLFVKRAIDVSGALLGLVAFAPVMAIAAILVKATSPGPVLFRQERLGYRKRRFSMYKFRTMVADAEARLASLEEMNQAGGPVFKLRGDPRITRIGSLLRRTSIDELPQLVNVLRGQMSLVGPRPLPLRDVSRFTEAALMRRFSVRPGMTGLWQVSGRSDLPFDEWFRLDLAYIDAWSLALDLRILARTVPVVLQGKGAA